MSRRLSAEMLKARLVRSPWSCHAIHCLRPVRTSQSVSWSISRNRSASGTKRAGSTGPWTGWVQRASASTPVSRPLAISTLGWKARVRALRSTASWRSVASASSSAETGIMLHLLVQDRRHQQVEPHRLGERRRHAQAHRGAEPHRRLEHALIEAADQDDSRLAAFLGEETQQFDAVASRQAEVEDDGVGRQRPELAPEALGSDGDDRL